VSRPARWIWRSRWWRHAAGASRPRPTTTARSRPGAGAWAARRAGTARPAWATTWTRG
jgi:hypothetical protein